jgi:hypothetical protein
VKKVENGFRGGREADIVVSDPSAVATERMLEALTRAGTRLGTAY